MSTLSSNWSPPAQKKFYWKQQSQCNLLKFFIGIVISSVISSVTSSSISSVISSVISSLISS